MNNNEIYLAKSQKYSKKAKRLFIVLFVFSVLEIFYRPFMEIWGCFVVGSEIDYYRIIYFLITNILNVFVVYLFILAAKNVNENSVSALAKPLRLYAVINIIYFINGIIQTIINKSFYWGNVVFGLALAVVLYALSVMLSEKGNKISGGDNDKKQKYINILTIVFIALQLATILNYVSLFKKPEIEVGIVTAISAVVFIVALLVIFSIFPYVYIVNAYQYKDMVDDDYTGIPDEPVEEKLDRTETIYKNLVKSAVNENSVQKEKENNE